MKKLIDILPKEVLAVHGDTSVEIYNLQLDSRSVDSGSVFFAIPGTQVDGHAFIDMAIDKGAKVVVCETLPTPLSEHITYVQVESSSETLAWMASTFYNHPSQKLKLIGITGTNGKTTVATLMYDLLGKLNVKSGLLSTVSNYIGDAVYPSTHTTGNAIEINKFLAQMVDAQCDFAVMEVSSHALDQNRVKYIKFHAAVFTNLTHDHLDYHPTFEHYRDTKKKLFDALDSDAVAIVNRDDKNHHYMVQNCEAPVFKYGVKNMADFNARVIEMDFQGMMLEIDSQQAWFTLTGAFNAANILAVYATAFVSGFDRTDVLTQLTAAGSVNGRFQVFRSSNGVYGIVDYAHTPDALENVLKTINAVKQGTESVITVVGCGGNRDVYKRPVMAKIALKQSAKVVFTSDNPRKENPERIIKDMTAELSDLDKTKCLEIPDRASAIKTAVMLANPGDVVLVAGKGHETYQEINGVRHHFDDREELSKAFNQNQHIH